MKFVWTATARDDFNSAIEYLIERNPYAAQKLISQIQKAEESLKTFPLMGWAAPNEVRLWPVGSFLLSYKILEDEILIIRLWHGAQNRV